MVVNHKQGDIYYAKLPGAKGSVQGGCRPVIIMQNNIGNRHSPTVTVVPLTSKVKRMEMPTHFCVKPTFYNHLNATSVALGEQITTISVANLNKKVGSLTNEELKQVQSAVLAQIQIS